MALGIVGVGVLVVIAGIAFKVLKNSTAPVSQSSAKTDLELIEHRAININFFNYVTGTIRNNTQNTFENVQVQIAIYSNDVLMGTTTASAKNLKPGGKWNFEAPVLEQGAYRYKFVSITGW